MATGILAVCLCLTLGQNPGDVRYANFRNLRVPVNVPPALQPKIRELLLYASTDQGREWKHVAGPISSDKSEFAFYAPADGTYWLRVVKVSQDNVHDPDDMNLMRGPADMKLVIDTVKPVVKTMQAQRQGDDIHVNWEFQENNPDLSQDGMRLEYQVKDAAFERWTAIPLSAALKGQKQFNSGEKRPLVIRLTVRDLAGNQSYGIAEVSGTVAPTGGILQAEGSGAAVLPSELILPKQPTESEKQQLPIAPLPKDNGTPKPVFPDLNVPPAPQSKENPGEKVIADSRFPPPPLDPPKIEPAKIEPTKIEPLKVGPPQREGQLPLPGGILPPPKEAPTDVKAIATAAVVRKPLPPLQYVNQHQVMLEYELRRVGPSGIGGIELWLTRDDGETWEPYAADEDAHGSAVNNRQKRKFDLRDASDRPFADGIYGLTLVVKNRAGMGKKPRPGDAPEIRIEIDTKPPFAQLLPPSADPQNPDQVLLRWTTEDKNLTATPICLEYAEKRDGPWQPIAADLENSGRYSWKVGPAVPVQVFLRLRARDKAGNESAAVTRDAQYIDFTEPEGALIGVLPQGKSP
jgi:hypothetical protein